jgi:hypothetical protein
MHPAFCLSPDQGPPEPRPRCLRGSGSVVEQAQVRQNQRNFAVATRRLEGLAYFQNPPWTRSIAHIH